MRPELHERPGAKVGRNRPRMGNHRLARVQHLDPVGDLVDDVDRLREVRRTGRISDETAGPDSVQRRGEQLDLQPLDRADVVRAAAPAQLWTSPQRAEPGARDVDQDPIDATRPPGGTPSISHDHRDAGVARNEPSPVRTEVDREDSCAAPVRFGGQQRRLAAGAGAEIQPPAGTGGSSGGQGDQLAPLVLNTGSSLTYGSDATRRTGVQDRRRRGPPPGPGPSREQFVDGAPPGTGGEMHRSWRVVRLEQGAYVVEITAERVRERGDDPPRVSVPQAECRDRVIGRGDLGEPAVQIAVSDPAQDRV